ncbi:MAG: MFS transporter [Anaerolineaceae bacterium]|nr:MFS transporter [Anaerolineaceae bacterium]
MKTPNLTHKWRTLWLLSLAELLAMVVWFSASAVTNDLAALWALDEAGRAWLTMSVQIGFVVGALGSAILTLADRIPARHFFIVATFLAAAATALIPFQADSPANALILRFLTGVFLAGVYPVGMKIMATWTQADRGLGIGLLVGALTIGSAAPHLLNALGGIGEWQRVLWVAAGLAALAGVIAAFFVYEGPYTARASRFRLGDIRHIVTDRQVMLANLGYLGHMWELYAMWAWLFAFLTASFAIQGTDSRWAGLVTFLAIASGGISSVVAGKLADRIGRPTVTSVSMAISGLCALVIGLFFGSNVLLVSAVALIWGFFIVADSAQFSASISELADKRFVGTALTLQTSMGFLLTLFTIRIIPTLERLLTWHWAFTFLAIGPVIGIVAMQLLRRSIQQTTNASN